MHLRPAAVLATVRSRSLSRPRPTLPRTDADADTGALLGRLPTSARPPKTTLPTPLGPGWHELGHTWSASIDDVFLSVRNALRIAPSVFALVLALTLMLVTLASSPSDPPAARSRVFRGGPSGADGRGADGGYPFSGRRAWKHDGDEMGAVYRKFGSIEAPTTARLSNSSLVRRRYALLAKLYLKPFTSIPRASYMDMLEGKGKDNRVGNETCSACFLIQVKDGAIFVYDPRRVRGMAEFREIRMREAIHWTTRAVRAGAVADTEFVVSTTDGVVSTCHPHGYRMPAPGPTARPVFTMTHCNVSENIPFPMVFTDLLRRGFKEKFWKARSGSIAQWDAVATGVLGAQRHEAHVWARKRRQAVFRGAIRIPAALEDADDYGKSCGRYGRTALEAKAETNRKETQEKEAVWRKNHWLWSVLGRTGFGKKATKAEGEGESGGEGEERSFLPALDVKISGVCGNKTYTTDNLDMEQQSQYRYTVHAEGNGFWADRLAIQLFGSSTIIKQLTPCGMFFEPLLRAYSHYVPVDYWFGDIVRQVEWARENDEEVRQMVVRARQFAGNYLTVSGISAYGEEILKEYTKRLDVVGKKGDGIRIHPHAIKLFPL